MLENLCKNIGVKLSLASPHVKICKYRNVGGSLYKKICVKMMWHAYMLRELTLMLLSGFHLYSYIG
jgi:hypothetical protein